MDKDVSKPRVVVGVDGSPSSYAALRWAVRYADLAGGTVDAVAAWELPGLYGWSAPAVDMDVDEEEARRRMRKELADVLGADAASKVREFLAHGNPAEVLLRAAEGAEVLVVGSRGRGGFASALLGSVSQHVSHHASCPVVIVRAETS
ncbi:universal stress protein [Streptomyces pluripotens]|uniref:Universal stress protein n=1 Tax=Streptomyces pluripotens TaxID=1355015 RepID=A0A221NSY7_9ACTN|nr:MULTISPECIES: universal stress protein [Streptomyces]ARP68638.1 universal stress protein UspA [Streptomyces pluripotens]ASN22898.1 universal stress protein [Streptomyces pluripotens]KIE26726.1 universal stress protein UspA [Streptomyces sp. MUSC 125]MCH0559272.1 universal stress protein [Streptomyces sp. MUM 16J]